jgi:hypothetical protein
MTVTNESAMTVTAIVHALNASDKPSFSEWRADRDRREQAERRVELPSHNHD